MVTHAFLSGSKKIVLVHACEASLGTDDYRVRLYMFLDELFYSTTWTVLIAVQNSPGRQAHEVRTIWG